ncbi:MAG: IS91 family transposase [Deltaproteobacteria bacterium]|nr:IS91 family transposase [Deltaproteobacteria bacterium]
MENPKPANRIEVADIFREFGRQYRISHNLPDNIIKVMHNIERCRTSFFGGHVDQCDECEFKRISYNSCGDRNCPKCGMLAKEKWLEQRKRELLPVPYYHIVFTIPQQLNDLAMYNPEIIYRILFRSAKETLIKLGKDAKHLGADIGAISVLHTWGQNLSFHPHLHCIVPGGGLSEDGKKWLYPKKSKKKKKFFVHVNVISDLFKKVFLYYLKWELNDGSLKGLENKGQISKLLNTLYKIKWITYCKKPFGGPKQVLEYICRYTHRVAISNNRIIKIEKGRVFFKWRDYKDGNKVKIMSLEADEFIRRFLMHILPSGFMKIHYFGILASRNKKTKLARCQEIFGVKTILKEDEEKISWQERFHILTGIDLLCCPKCKKGKMCLKEKIEPLKRAPS